MPILTFPRRIAVIGAGISGLSCAQALKHAGLRVNVYEKSRGLGGRLATRRPFGRDHALGVDHGAPYVQADQPSIQDELAALGAWWAEPQLPQNAIVGVPGMSDLARPLAEGLEVTTGTEIESIARGDDDTILRDVTGGVHGPFDAVAVAVPAPQVGRLLGADPTGLADAVMAPCWTLLLAFEERLETDLVVAKPDEGPFELLVRNSAKPDRSDTYDAWVGHCRPNWSAEHLEEEKEAMAAKLLEAFRQTFGGEPPAPSYCAAHRWRYARVVKPAGSAYWLSADGALGCCGDWRLGALAGDAYRSGAMLGRAMAQKLTG